MLTEVDFTLAKAGSCEDTGRPWTRLAATVVEWGGRPTASRYLLDRGWVHEEGNRLRSPDGAYRAQVVNARDKTVTAEPYALVYFEEVADEEEWIDAAR